MKVQKIARLVKSENMWSSRVERKKGVFIRQVHPSKSIVLASWGDVSRKSRNQRLVGRNHLIQRSPKVVIGTLGEVG